MFLHLGNDFTISSRNLICILNLRSSSLFPDAIRSIKSQKTRKIGENPPRSAVICKKGAIYLSPMNSLTLIHRIIRNEDWVRQMEGKYGEKSQE